MSLSELFAKVAEGGTMFVVKLSKCMFCKLGINTEGFEFINDHF